MDAKWLAKASLYELLAQGFRQTTPEFSRVIQSGEFAQALDELARDCGLDSHAIASAIDGIGLTASIEAGEDAFFHWLRQTYTRIFIGGFEPLASPFAGTWWAEKQGIPPVHMLNAESLAVAQAMRDFGLTHSENKNAPLDSIVAELEFLQYLCALLACAEDGEAQGYAAADLQAAYEAFYAKHFLWFAHELGQRLVEVSSNPFYEALGTILAAMPERPL